MNANEVMAMIPQVGLKYAARVMLHGKKHDKDGRPGWVDRTKTTRGIENEIAAIKRHMDKIEAGEVLDVDSGLPHAAHIAVRALILASVDFENAKEYGKPGETPSGLVFCG